jgi:hypothetical protein
VGGCSVVDMNLTGHFVPLPGAILTSCLNTEYQNRLTALGEQADVAHISGPTYTAFINAVFR